MLHSSSSTGLERPTASSPHGLGVVSDGRTPVPHRQRRRPTVPNADGRQTAPHGPCQGPATGTHDPSLRLARVFAYGFVALLVWCVAFGIEWWPLTSFRLFSEVRGPEQRGWEIVVVDRTGREHPVERTTAPGGYKGGQRAASLLPTMADAERERTLRAWAAAVDGSDVTAVRVYRITRRTPTRPDVAPWVVARELRYQVDVDRP